MNKRAVIIIAVIIVAAMLIGVVAPHMSGGSDKTVSKDDAGKKTEAVSTENTKDQSAEDLSAEEDTLGSEKTDEQNSVTSEEGGPSGGGSSNGNSGNNEFKSETGKKESGEQSSSGKGSGGKTADIPTISFPYTIPGTDLVIQQINSYSGYFIEDGSDEKVSDIAAIVLKNNGGDLEFAGIGIAQGSRSLGFSASQIPAGATVVIQEQKKATYSSEPYYSATATTKPVDKFEMSEKLVTVEDNGSNGLVVTNISDKKISEVRVCFKSYLPKEKAYVGGITYTITLKDLEPGASTEVSAGHYESKYSKVVEVKVKSK